jgi:sirohydrochlorin cobaltochelatase
MEAIAQRARTLLPDGQVRCAYLEHTLPDLPQCIAELVQSGLHRIRIVPMFLGVGSHLRNDLPVILAQLQKEHPDVELTLGAALGEMETVLDALAHCVTHRAA